MIQKYVKFIDGKFAGFFDTQLKEIKVKNGDEETITYEPTTPYPEEYVLINDEEHEKLHSILSKQENGLLLFDLTLENGRVHVVDKYSIDYVKQFNDKLNQTNLVAEAKQLIKDNEWRWNNKIKWDEYSKEKRQQITAYYKALVAVVNGESNTLPEGIF